MQKASRHSRDKRSRTPYAMRFIYEIYLCVLNARRLLVQWLQFEFMCNGSAHRGASGLQSLLVLEWGSCSDTSECFWTRPEVAFAPRYFANGP